MIQPNAHPGVSLSHDQARELIQKSLQARPDDCEQTALESHLASCPSCAAYAAEMRALDLRLAGSLPERWPEPRYSPAELNHRLSAMHTRLRRVTLWRSARFFGSLAGAAAILMLLILGLNQIANRAAPRPVMQVNGPVAMTATPSPAIQVMTVTIARPKDFTPGPTATPSGFIPVEKPASTPLPNMIDPADLQPSGQLTQAGAEKLVRAWIFANNQDMNPAAQFPLEEMFPMDLWSRLQAQVFKVTEGVQQGETYLIRKGQVLHLGTAFGSTGMTLDDFVLCALNGDSYAELLYTYPFGSGLAQTGIGIVFYDEAGSILVQREFTSVDHSILRLEKFTDRQVYLYKQGASANDWTRYGQITGFDNQGIIIRRDTTALSIYTSQRFGVSFKYPADWTRQERIDNHEAFSGLSGDLDLYSLGFGRTDDDLFRACEQQVNARDKVYEDPQILQAHNAQQRSLCFIVSPAGYRSAVLFLAANEQIGILQVDSAHIEAVGASLRFEALPTSTSPAVDMTPQTPPAKLAETIQKLGELSLTEWKVVSAGVDTPGHFEFNSRIPDNVLARRSGAINGGVDWTNQQLALFSYQIEGPKSSPTGSVYTLYHGDQLVQDNISTFFALTVSEKDFAMLIEVANSSRWLVRSGSVEPWDDMLHRYIRPVFVDGHLMTVERQGNGAQSDAVVVKEDGQVVFSYTLAPQPVKEAVKALDEWNGQWVLEVNGTLIVNGQVYNSTLPAGEIFNWTKINGKPFFFFTRPDGKVSLWYNGQALPAEYDQVIHNQCFERAAFNVTNSPTGLWFYALKDGAWYFVEVTPGPRS